MPSFLLRFLPVAESWSLRRIVIAAAGYYLAYRVCRFIYACWRHTRSPLHKLPGPRDDALFLIGHTRSLLSGENMEAQEGWLNTYGDTLSLRGLMGKYQLMTTDTRALTHILFATHVFHKPEVRRRALKSILGEGVLWSEGEQHRDQRRIINPAFGHAHVRDMTEIFVEKAAKLRGVWCKKCVEAGGSVRLNAIDWLSKATLDAIGRAGFDYDFDTLNENGPRNELAEAFDKVFRADDSPRVILRLLLNAQFPIFKRIIPDKRTVEFEESKKLMDEAGMRIVQEKKREILAELAGAQRIEKKAVGGKDLISLLLRANLVQDLDPSLRLSDEEVLAQIPTFLVAGHETTSNSTSWAMYALATHPEMQERLRAELQNVGTETPTLEQLNALPYLDHVVRESLRVYSVVPFISRAAAQDDIIPLEKPVQDADGNTVSFISVNAGDEVLIPIAPLNRSKAIWGPDADDFRPQRWENPPAAASAIPGRKEPGITPNLMSFIGGPRSCVGHRFAVAEMKALLFHIVRGFGFTLAVDPSELFTRAAGILRPQLRADNSVQLPVLLTPIA